MQIRLQRQIQHLRYLRLRQLHYQLQHQLQHQMQEVCVANVHTGVRRYVLNFAARIVIDYCADPVNDRVFVDKKN